MRTLIAVPVLVLLASNALAGEPSIKSLPPVVVKTAPQSGDTAVDPKLKEIKVTFSKDMQTEKMWSFVQVSRDTFPKVGQPRYVDPRTIVLPVTLQPQKTYAIWVNSKKNNAFRDVDNHPAVPYLLVFETK